jgi:drug/metabolite transporter (DMT)-like permease
MKPIIGQFWLALSPPLQATVLMVTAMAFFTSMSIFIRLSAQEIHVLQVVFFRNFLALLLLLPWLMKQGFSTLRTKRFGLLLTRSTVNVIGMAAGFYSLTLIPLAEATALGFTAPLWATLGAVLILGEVIRLRRMTALVFGFIGVMIVLRPGVESVSLGSVLALGHAFVIAVTTLIVKRLTVTESTTSIVIWMVLLQSPLSLLPALYVWEWPTLTAWLWLWCLAGAGTLGHLCWTRAFTIAEVSQLQPFEFIKLPMIAILAYLVFAEQPTVWTWLGGTVIFASTAYISIREASLARQRATSA